jgi:hypothetical protein
MRHSLAHPALDALIEAYPSQSSCNISPRPAAATCVTTVPATLVTNLYGQPADQVHQRDRPAAGVPK